MERRTVIASGGALAAVGVLAACGGSQTAEEVVGEDPQAAPDVSEVRSHRRCRRVDYR
jgi:hypothetical protein